MNKGKINQPLRSNEIRLSFPATLENVDRTSDKIARIFRDAGIKKDNFNILLGIREAFTNAVKHGSRCDSSKHVRVYLIFNERHLIAEVADEGEGFDWKSYLKKNLPSKEESGRGLAIMKAVFTKVKYNPKGNRLILKKAWNRQKYDVICQMDDLNVRH